MFGFNSNNFISRLGFFFFFFFAIFSKKNLYSECQNDLKDAKISCINCIVMDIVV